MPEKKTRPLYLCGQLGLDARKDVGSLLQDDVPMAQQHGGVPVQEEAAVVGRKALRPEEPRGVGPVVVAPRVVRARVTPLVLPALDRRRLQLFQEELVVALRERGWGTSSRQRGGE